MDWSHHIPCSLVNLLGSFMCFYITDLLLMYVQMDMYNEQLYREIRFFCLSRTRNVLFNDALNKFYLRLYGIRHMVKDHSDSERGNLLPPHGLLFSINS